MALNGYDLALMLRNLAADLPKGAEAGVLKAAAVLEETVAVTSGKYRGRRIVRTVTVPLPPMSAEVKMVSRLAHILDHDTKAHDIGPSRSPVLVIGGAPSGQPITGAVHSPGTKGKMMWERALDVAGPKMQEAISDAVGATLLKDFG